MMTNLTYQTNLILNEVKPYICKLLLTMTLEKAFATSQIDNPIVLAPLLNHRFVVIVLSFFFPFH